MELIREFARIGKNDAAIAGGKGASLGEMTQAGIPVPPGFVVLASTFDRFIEETDLNVEIDSILGTVNNDEMHTVENASAKIQGLIHDAVMPADIGEEIMKEFKKLGAEFVAVRSSATAEDGASAAWAGQLDTYLNTTESGVIRNVQRCWASLFTPRAIFYRFEKELHKQKISVAVVVQKMVNSDSAGIAFSVHPVTEDYNQIIIEAGFGLGEAVVSGQVTPDAYVVTKAPREILDKNIAEQDRGLFRKEGGGNEWKELGSQGHTQVLSDEQILALSETVMGIENHYGFPCDIEWAKEGSSIYITQSRPITTLTNNSATTNQPLPPPNSDTWLLGEKIPNSDIFFFQIPWNQFPNVSSHEFLKKPKNILAVYNGFEMDFYTGEKDSKEVADSILQALIDRPEFGPELNEKIAEWSYKMIDFAKGVAAKDLEALSNSELFDLYQEHFDIHTKLYTYGWLPVAVDIYHNNFTDYLKEYLYSACKTREEAEDAFVVLTTPSAKTIIAEEREEFLAIAEKFADEEKKPASPKLMDALAAHAKKWGHLGYIYAGNVEPFNAEHYLKEITDLASTNTTPKQILEREEAQLAEAKKKQEKLYGELSMPETYKRLFTVGQNFALTKLVRRHAQLLTLYLLHTTLLEEIAKRLKLTRYQVQFMMKREVKNALENGTADSELLSERLRHCVFYSGESFEEVYTGQATQQFIKGIVVEVDPNIMEFSGQTANPGKATGIAKFIQRASDIPKMNEGDILISIATDPDVVPAMKKAAAIVTEQGGITAHAAIVSRELNKPCVIGTKIATKVIQDGDLVEVDATRGIVRILKKAGAQ